MKGFIFIFLLFFSLGAIAQTGIGIKKRKQSSSVRPFAPLDSLIATLDATYWKLGGQAIGANANIGSTDGFRFGVTTNGTARLYFGSSGRVFSNTVTDFILTASDSARFAGAGGTFDITSGFTRLYQSSNLAWQVNNSNLSQAMNVGDNLSTAFQANILGGATWLQVVSTDGAEVTALGTTTSGASTVLNGSVRVKDGAGTANTVGGVLKDFYTSVNNTSTTETDLYTYTTVASTLSTNGDKLMANVSGTFNDATATGTIRAYFAGNDLTTGVPAGVGTGSWTVEIFLIRTGSSTARAVTKIVLYEDTEAYYVNQVDLTGITWTNTNIIKVTGQAGGGGGGNDDVTAKLGVIEFKPAGVN